ncbi:MAG: DUF6318 family protein [Actinomycetaceae bacterium]|nr:DUF6318 family protein [Actinomycetaceae bacterium]
MCPDRHDYGGGSPRYSGAARRGEDREFERDDPEMDRVIRRWWWAAGISWLVAICVVYLTFCHKPPQEPSTSAVRPAAPAAVVQSGAGQSGAGQSGGGAGGQSGATGGQSVGDGPMSNGYRVGPDGRLLQPDQGNLMPPELPDEAKQESAAGAEAYVKHYLEVNVYTWNTGDTALMKENFTPKCESCAQTTKRIDDFYSAGGWIEVQGNLETQVAEIVSHENPQSGRAAHSVIIHFTLPGQTVYKDNSLSSVDPVSQTAAIDCCWVNNRWKVCGVDAKTN